MRTLALPDAVAQLSLTGLREKLIKIGAKIVRHGRYVTFQMAEVATPVTCSPTSCIVSTGLDRQQPQHDQRDPTLWARRQDRYDQIMGKKVESPQKSAIHRSRLLATRQKTAAGCAPNHAESESTRRERFTWELSD
jgi:hypothetical protein